MSKLESDIVRETMLALGQRDDVLIWRQNTGAAELGGCSQGDLRDAIAVLTNQKVSLAQRMADSVTVLRRALNRKTRVVRFSMKGQADLTGVLSVVSRGGHGKIGVRLEVELKSEKGRQSKEQRNFEAMMLSAGVVYVCARSASEAVDRVEQAKREIERWLV